jgi:hypothetical protein
MQSTGDWICARVVVPARSALGQSMFLDWRAGIVGQADLKGFCYERSTDDASPEMLAIFSPDLDNSVC